MLRRNELLTTPDRRGDLLCPWSLILEMITTRLLIRLRNYVSTRVGEVVTDARMTSVILTMIVTDLRNLRNRRPLPVQEEEAIEEVVAEVSERLKT